MNQNKTLSEICKELSITRKVIQGYEHHGLINSSGKDKHGKRIYSEKTLDEIIKIRFYQKLGFSLTEIKKIISYDNERLKNALIRKREETDKKIQSLYKAQSIINSLISDGVQPDFDFMLEIIKMGDLK